MIEYAELYEKGIAPIEGAALDQTHVFVQASRFIWSEQKRWKARLGILP